MKKEEFPTFLNEQPTVVFGRTMRELLLIVIGLAVGYFCWLQLGKLLPGDLLGFLVLRGFCAFVMLAAFVTMAFVNIASRPLEEWILVGIFYYFTPKVFIYMPLNEDDLDRQGLSAEQHQRDTRSDDEDDEGME